MCCSAWILLSFCAIVSSQLDDKSCRNGEDCSPKHIISMPLLDSMKATLRADLDVTEMNKFLEAYIQQEIKKGIETAMAATIENMVKSCTTEMESRISEKFKGNELLTVYLYVTIMYLLIPSKVMNYLQFTCTLL